MQTLIEYRVRPVTRFVVTRCERQVSDDWTAGTQGSVTEKGEFPNNQTAYDVATALCKDEHQRLGWPLDDPRIRYPQPLTVSSEASHAANEREVRAAVGEDVREEHLLSGRTILSYVP